MTAMAAIANATPIAPTAMPAFAPVEREPELLLPLSLPLPLPLPPKIEVAVAVAAAVVPLNAEPAVEVLEFPMDSVEPFSDAVTAYPLTQDMVPPTDKGRLACLVKACWPINRVALLVQSHEPSRSSDVYESDGTEHPAHAHSSAVLLTALQRMRPTHSWLSKSSDFHGHELSVYCGSVQPARYVFPAIPNRKQEVSYMAQQTH